MFRFFSLYKRPFIYGFLMAFISISLSVIFGAIEGYTDSTAFENFGSFIPQTFLVLGFILSPIFYIKSKIKSDEQIFKKVLKIILFFITCEYLYFVFFSLFFEKSMQFFLFAFIK